MKKDKAIKPIIISIPIILSLMISGCNKAQENTIDISDENIVISNKIYTIIQEATPTPISHFNRGIGYDIPYTPIYNPEPSQEISDESQDKNPEPQASPTPTKDITETQQYEESKESKKIGMIIDLDYNTDVDDVCAIRIATQLDKENRIELKGIASSTQGTEVTKAMHAQLSHDGYGHIPVGYSVGHVAQGSPYWSDMIKAYYDEKTFVCTDSTSLYKSILKEASETGQTIRIATTGYLVNIAALLKDPEGYELLKNNSDYLFITGGEWTSGYDYNFTHTQEAADAIKYVYENCPIPIVFSSYYSIQEGDAYVMCGGAVLREDTLQKDPITIAFRAYERRNEASLSAGRFAWDPICVWAACLPQEETQMSLTPISVWIGNDGNNAFSAYNEAVPLRYYLLTRNSTELGWYKNQLDSILIRGIKQSKNSL